MRTLISTFTEPQVQEKGNSEPGEDAAAAKSRAKRVPRLLTKSPVLLESKRRSLLPATKLGIVRVRSDTARFSSVDEQYTKECIARRSARRACFVAKGTCSAKGWGGGYGSVGKMDCCQVGGRVGPKERGGGGQKNVRGGT